MKKLNITVFTVVSILIGWAYADCPRRPINQYFEPLRSPDEYKFRDGVQIGGDEWEELKSSSYSFTKDEIDCLRLVHVSAFSHSLGYPYTKMLCQYSAPDGAYIMILSLNPTRIFNNRVKYILTKNGSWSAPKLDKFTNMISSECFDASTSLGGLGGCGFITVMNIPAQVGG